MTFRSWVVDTMAVCSSSIKYRYKNIKNPDTAICYARIFLWIRAIKNPRPVVFEYGTRSGPEGNRTPVRKSIPCTSTIIVRSLTFPLPDDNEQPSGFGSFIIRLQAQSFACIVSHMVDARILMCECIRADEQQLGC